LLSSEGFKQDNIGGMVLTYKIILVLACARQHEEISAVEEEAKNVNDQERVRTSQGKSREITGRYSLGCELTFCNGGKVGGRM